MKQYLAIVLILTGFLVFAQRSFCQTFTNDASDKEKHFIYQVKQIDEFFERFNNDSASFVRQVYKTHNTKFNVDRKKLIRSLFNYENKNWSKSLIDSFVAKGLKVEMPSSKNWYGDNWFAEANCRFRYNSTVIEIPVILKIVTDEKKRFKWVIAGVRQSLLKESDNSNTPITIRKIKTNFINPADHGTNFIELENAFNEKDHLSDYFENSFFYRKNAVQFYHALITNKIKFLFVKDVKYHFLNVNGFVFTVEYFPRESLYSGWLVNSLKACTSREMEKYKTILLGE